MPWVFSHRPIYIFSAHNFSILSLFNFLPFSHTKIQPTKASMGFDLMELETAAYSVLEEEGLIIENNHKLAVDEIAGQIDELSINDAVKLKWVEKFCLWLSWIRIKYAVEYKFSVRIFVLRISNSSSSTDTDSDSESSTTSSTTTTTTSSSSLDSDDLSESEQLEGANDLDE